MVIPNAELKESDVPPPDADWGWIGHFALTFNGYEYWGSFEACGTMANQWREAWQKARLLPSTLTELRTCLFFEQRRWHHAGYDPDAEAMTYIRALLEAIRAKICAGERDAP